MELERRQAVVLEGDGLAVNQAGAQPQRTDGLDDEREALGPVVAVAGDEPDAGGIAARHQPGPEGGFSAGDGRQGNRGPGWHVPSPSTAPVTRRRRKGCRGGANILPPSRAMRGRWRLPGGRGGA
jgi:hypothetical protein